MDFLAVSTPPISSLGGDRSRFQFRRGFSGCLDPAEPFLCVVRRDQVSIPSWIFWLSRPDFDAAGYNISKFQFRRGFSGCLDSMTSSSVMSSITCFNSVVDFLAVSTLHTLGLQRATACFNSVVDFLAVSTPTSAGWTSTAISFNSVVDFLAVSTRRQGVKIRL